MGITAQRARSRFAQRRKLRIRTEKETYIGPIAKAEHEEAVVRARQKTRVKSKGTHAGTKRVKCTSGGNLN